MCTISISLFLYISISFVLTLFTNYMIIMLHSNIKKCTIATIITIKNIG